MTPSYQTFVLTGPAGQLRKVPPGIPPLCPAEPARGPANIPYSGHKRAGCEGCARRDACIARLEAGTEYLKAGHRAAVGRLEFVEPMHTAVRSRCEDLCARCGVLQGELDKAWAEHAPHRRAVRRGQEGSGVPLPAVEERGVGI